MAASAIRILLSLMIKEPLIAMGNKKALSAEKVEKLISTLKARFEKNKNRHKDIEWVEVQARLEANPEKRWSLHEMEDTGGEPDVVGYDEM